MSRVTNLPSLYNPRLDIMLFPPESDNDRRIVIRDPHGYQVVELDCSLSHQAIGMQLMQIIREAQDIGRRQALEHLRGVLDGVCPGL